MDLQVASQSGGQFLPPLLRAKLTQPSSGLSSTTSQLASFLHFSSVGRPPVAMMLLCDRSIFMSDLFFSSMPSSAFMPAAFQRVQTLGQPLAPSQLQRTIHRRTALLSRAV